MSEIKIEKGIPVPLGAGSSGKTIYPWCEMEVGDSFFVPGGKAKGAGQANQDYAPKRFASRKEDGGVRFWRIA